MSSTEELFKVFEKKYVKPLTVEEVREQLKHIASLCLGLSIDLQRGISDVPCSPKGSPRA